MTKPVRPVFLLAPAGIGASWSEYVMPHIGGKLLLERHPGGPGARRWPRSAGTLTLPSIAISVYLDWKPSSRDKKEEPDS